MSIAAISICFIRHAEGEVWMVGRVVEAVAEVSSSQWSCMTKLARIHTKHSTDT